MFCLQFSQNGLKHSWFFFVTHTLHTRQFRTFSQTVFLPPSLFVLCFSKHERLLKFLLQDSHGTLSSAKVHGGIDLQSLHVSPHLWVSPRLHPLLQPLHTYLCAIASVRLFITWKCLYSVIHQVNSFFGFYLTIKICSRNSILRKRQSCTLWNVPGSASARVLPHRATGHCQSYGVSGRLRDVFYGRDVMNCNSDRRLLLLLQWPGREPNSYFPLWLVRYFFSDVP